MHVMRAHHDVYIRCFFTHHFFVFLRQTTGNNNLALTAKALAGFFPRLQPAKSAVQLLVCIFSNTTGVQHHHIGVVFVFGHFHAVLLEQSRNSLGVVRIHLAPKGAHNIFTSHSGSSLPPHYLRLPRNGSPAGQRGGTDQRETVAG